MQIEQAIELLKASGYRVSKLRANASNGCRALATKGPIRDNSNQSVVRPLWPVHEADGAVQIFRLTHNRGSRDLCGFLLFIS
jgi:hypothetical protein